MRRQGSWQVAAVASRRGLPDVRTGTGGGDRERPACLIVLLVHRQQGGDVMLICRQEQHRVPCLCVWHAASCMPRSEYELHQKAVPTTWGACAPATSANVPAEEAQGSPATQLRATQVRFCATTYAGRSTLQQ